MNYFKYIHSQLEASIFDDHCRSIINYEAGDLLLSNVEVSMLRKERYRLKASLELLILESSKENYERVISNMNAIKFYIAYKRRSSDNQKIKHFKQVLCL